MINYSISLILATLSVVNCQQATILHPKNKETRISDGYKCYNKLSGNASGIRAKSSVEVQFFKNDDCSGNWIQMAWGNYNFTKNIQYYSVKLDKHQKKVKAESADDETKEDNVMEATDDAEVTEDVENKDSDNKDADNKDVDNKDDSVTTEGDEAGGTEENNNSDKSNTL